ncbi:MAG: zinc-ribbon domain-containing protein [Clostridiales bacterium]|nr:zinc-ribbon domain-containing protein [Candidatus Equinaster intestinalis]
MSKFCGKCGTENKDEYNFCKKCGTPLSYGRNPHTYENRPSKDFFTEAHGISIEEMEAAVGNNSQRIIGKFNRMHKADSKISWCWPVAVLSYFFGLFGAAIWFFYRKMYKAAIICLAISVALGVGKFFISREPMTEYIKGVVSITEEMTQKIQKNAQNENSDSSVTDVYNDFLKEYTDYISEYSASSQLRYSSLLDMAERYISTIMLGMFALYLYKKHILKKAKTLKEKYTDDVSYKNALARSGGTSGGMAVLGIFVYIIASSIPALFLFILIK